jgi:hypothetical protein
MQRGQPMCYVAKALTETEQRYSNIERETLGVVRGLQMLHYFIYGKRVTQITHLLYQSSRRNCLAVQLSSQTTEVCTESTEVRRHNQIC